MTSWSIHGVYRQHHDTITISDAIVMSFSHTDGGLIAKDGNLKGFGIAGSDRQW